MHAKTTLYNTLLCVSIHNKTQTSNTHSCIKHIKVNKWSLYIELWISFVDMSSISVITTCIKHLIVNRQHT